MSRTALEFPKAGESKLYGYAGSMVAFTIENQLLDAEKWALFVEQFRLKPDGENQGWRGEYWGKMMRGASLTYRATKNEKLYAVLVETIKDMISVQEPNGCISTYTVERELVGSGWDVWARKYVMLGMTYFLDICKNKTLAKKIIRCLKRQANYIIARVGEGKGKRSIFDTSWCVGAMNSCSILESFVKLYNYTGEQKYLDYATYLVGTGLCVGENLIE